VKPRSSNRTGRAARPTVVRLYLAGVSRNSAAAVKNVDAAAAELPGGSLDIELVDVFKFPERALADGVLVTPTLIRISPRPRQIVIGDLSDQDALRAVLSPRAKPTSGAR